MYKMGIRFLTAAGMLLCAVAGFAQPPVVSPGKVLSVTVSGQQVAIKAEHAEIRLTVYSADIIRVRMNRAKLEDDFSYAVIASPLPVKVNITQSSSEVVILTDSIKAVISKTPFAIRFLDREGHIINQDEDGLTTSWIGDEVTTYKKMQAGERFIGLGEKTGNLDRSGNGYTNWNSDVFGYSSGQDPLYSSIPFYIGIHDSLNYGIFLDNTFQTDFNFGASNNRFSSFGARGGEMNYYFIYHRQLADIIGSYTWLTGRMQLPPLWSLGYQQNRYSYYPETEVLRIAQTLREKKIPADGITLDIHYMDNYKLFTWNKERFPDPAGLTKKLRDMGLHTTVIVDPGIKVEKGYGAYERGLKDNIFLKYSDGKPYTGQVWPGWCHFPDFTSEKGRAWWKQEIRSYAGDGVDGIWNDMNEIATWGQKMPNNVLFDYDGHPTSHQEGHNVFGMEMARSSYEGYRQANKNTRPFILTRAGYAGLQRYTAIWTGDNRSEDDHMLAGVRLLNSLGLSGVPFTGMDIGGFTGNPSVNLYIRWMQLGAFIPYYRNHTAVNTPSSEPWAHGEEALEIARNYINLRYRLLPYMYSTFYEATRTGMPVVRSLAIQNTFDPKVYDPQFQNQFMFGPSLLVAPVTGNASFVKVYFPGTSWYNLYTGEKEAGRTEKIVSLSLNKLPVYVQESSIIPMQSLVQSTSEKPTDTLDLHIYNGGVPNTMEYYEDDGASYDYEQGTFFRRSISFRPAERSIVLDKASGSYASRFRYIRLVMHGFNELAAVKIDGAAKDLSAGMVSFLTPISTFDPQGTPNKVEGYTVQRLLFQNRGDRVVINY